MSELNRRKVQPDCLRHFLETMLDKGETTATIELLVAALMRRANYSKSTAKEMLLNAIDDGFLIPVSLNSNGSARGRLHEQRLVRLPEEKEFSHSKYDSYCFECHLPGALENCRRCPRTFHRLCYRKDPERPNYSVPSAKLQKHVLPVFSSETDSDSALNEKESTILGSTPVEDYGNTRGSSSQRQSDVDNPSMTRLTPQNFIDEIIGDSISSLVTPSETVGVPEGKHIVDGTESKSNIEVICLGEVRPPTRKRPATTASNISYKSEVSQSDDDDADLEMCTCCRLLKIAELRNPPNMKADELCHLLEFTFVRNRSWAKDDVFSYLDSRKCNRMEKKLISKLLFIKPDQSFDSIALKLRNQKYTSLMEFFINILELQHSFGVFFGNYSTEIEATKWLVRDITHDLSEIRRCPDCFRYSHEKRSNIWFAKPCLQRHELVYAKCSGFPYWPAKVIRVLPNNKHDVRFFGGNHSRALLDVRFIRPIDTDFKSLNIDGNSRIKKAMEELRHHQCLSTYPPSKFSFHADKKETEEIIRNVLGNSGLEVSAKKRKRSSNAGPPAKHMLEVTATSHSTSQRAVKKGIKTKSTVSTKSNAAGESNQPRHVTRSATKHSINSEIFKKMEESLETAQKVAEANKKKNEKLYGQIKKLKDTINKYEQEKKILKRKQWCYWCLNEAIYLCCFRAAYCSQICQSRHWKDGHEKVCKNHEQ